MAGDWIKIEHVTPDKPEVVTIAGILGLDQDAVFGKLCRFWIWADQQSLNGHALSVTEMFVDRVCCHAGIASAMRKVGWLTCENGTISLPNFDNHNGETAKARALAARRQKINRSRRQRDNSVTREEKRRDIPPSEVYGTKKKFEPPSVAQVAAYCQERGNSVEADSFVSFYESKGWMIGKNRMKDWKAAVRTWEKNEHGSRTKSREQLREDANLGAIGDFLNSHGVRPGDGEPLRIEANR